MYYLTLDTNTWIYLANGTEPVKILSFIYEEIENENLRIILPEIIIAEWNRNKDNAVKKGGLKAYGDITKAFDKIIRLTGDGRDPLEFLLKTEDHVDDSFQRIIGLIKNKKSEVEHAVEANISFIESIFRHPTTIILPTTDDILIKTAQTSIDKKAPFGFRNSGADAVIVFSFLEYIYRQNIHGALFVSYNTDDYCQKQNQKYFLHPDLELEFKLTKAKFFTIVGEAVNQIKDDIISQRELEQIRLNQKLDEELRATQDHYCEPCSLYSHRRSDIIFNKHQPLSTLEQTPTPSDSAQIKMGFFEKVPVLDKPAKHDRITVGRCDYCSTLHMICSGCSTVNAIYDFDLDSLIQCEGCELIYLIDTSKDMD